MPRRPLPFWLQHEERGQDGWGERRSRRTPKQRGFGALGDGRALASLVGGQCSGSGTRTRPRSVVDVESTASSRRESSTQPSLCVGRELTLRFQTISPGGPWTRR